MSADRSRVLLTLHARAKRWFQTGGHCEPGDASLVGAALREAAEESGIAGLRLDPAPVHLDVHDVACCGSRGDVRHLDVRFRALAPPRARAVAGEESDDLAWWPVGDLPEDEPGLHTLVRLARRRG